MASLLAQLPGPINLRLVLSDLKFADILHDLVTAKGNRSGVPRVLAVDRNETRELAGTLHIEGAGKDNAIDQIRVINKLVTVGTTLTLRSTDATDAVTLNILPSRGVSQPLDELFELPGTASGVLASCAFSFTCEPYAYGPEVTLLNGAGITAPCLVDLGTVPGDYPAPLSLQFVTNSDGFHAIYCGLRYPGSWDSIANYLREAESMSWSGGNTGVGYSGTAHSALILYNESTGIATGETPDAVSPGTYVLLSRNYMQDGGDLGAVWSGVGEWAWPTSPNFDLYELGRAHLPAKLVRGDEVSSHSVKMYSSSGAAGHPIVLDWYGFVPTSWGYFCWHPTKVTALNPVPRYAYATKLNVQADGGVYVGDVGNLADFKGAPISCVGPSQLVIFAEDRGQAAGCVLNLTATVTPRYALWA